MRERLNTFVVMIASLEEIVDFGSTWQKLRRAGGPEQNPLVVLALGQCVDPVVGSECAVGDHLHLSPEV